MIKCKHCEEEVPQVPGKKKKEFCNNTCRSNYWYAKNKKKEKNSSNSKREGEQQTKELNKPLPDFKDEIDRMFWEEKNKIIKNGE
jgi:hypothetical protein